MKRNKSKGFTLIELMVVISIIALLSSVVFASLKNAREKAVLTKTVGEMKSLQNAIELYKNKNGRYPLDDSPETFFTDDVTNDCRSYALYNYGCSNLDTFLSTALVADKLIPKIPHAPNYPNNCTVPNCDMYDTGYVLGYSYSPYSITSANFDPYWYTCGGKKIDNYVIFFSANYKKINLPIMLYNYGSNDFTMSGDSDLTAPPYVYCLSM